MMIERRARQQDIEDCDEDQSSVQEISDADENTQSRLNTEDQEAEDSLMRDEISTDQEIVASRAQHTNPSGLSHPIVGTATLHNESLQVHIAATTHIEDASPVMIGNHDEDVNSQGLPTDMNFDH